MTHMDSYYAERDQLTKTTWGLLLAWASVALLSLALDNVPLMILALAPAVFVLTVKR